MITEDFESAMKLRYLEVNFNQCYLKSTRIRSSTKLIFQPIVGYRLTNGESPFRTVTAPGLGHREVQCIDDHELQLDQVISGPLPKIPLDVSIRGSFYFIITKSFLIFTFSFSKQISLAHWLAIEGKQPTINENPEIIPKADVNGDALDPVRKQIIFRIRDKIVFV